MTNTTNEELSSYKIDLGLLEACIHCGLCLPACPTYQATGRETESPRGRIYLLNLWQRKELELTDRLVEHIDSCLGCMGCQTACPSGVQYEKILNQARPALAQTKNPATRKMMRYIFSKVLPDYGLLRRLAQVLRLWQKTGSENVFDVLPWLKNILGKYNQWRVLLPPVPKFEPLPRQSWAPGEKKGTVQLFAGCVMDVLYNHVNHACRRLLVAQQQVVNVPEQTCCGALAFHAGETDIAQELAKSNIELFETNQGPIVVTAAGCGAMLKGYGELLETDSEWHERAKEFSSRVIDITEFLNQHEFACKPKELKKKVAYHAACHL
ncbi:MAG: (Fe-S)-binding protein, partial [Candidatus Obscuribacterales bacterium]|nr:(Fe-S)-binding protein [Candidatus Obscuribacterales bacterium]